MVEGLLDRDSLGWVEREELLDEVEEVTVDWISGRDNFLSKYHTVRSRTCQ